MLQLSAETAYRRQRLAAFTIIDIADVVGRVWGRIMASSLAPSTR
jgi:hypothetical protein